jgi:hypothetical protein
MSRGKRVGPDANNAEANQTRTPPEIRNSHSIASPGAFDFDQQVVSQMDTGLWEALFDGDFRLAIPCRVCGRFLTSSVSTKARVGRPCAAKAGDDT